MTAASAPASLSVLPELALEDITAARAAFDAARHKAFDDFRSRRDPDALNRHLRALADELLVRLWRNAGLCSGWALLAVGGYGRGDLFPHSDVDLLILVDGEPNETAQRGLETFIGHCWDMGLAIGQAVRSVAECVSEQAADVTIQTALLERRFLTGARPLAAALDAALADSIDPVAFMAAKTVEMQRRHARFQDTP
ncbi:MAG: nucleotidyltransferase domain-containing protein, partial [Burkholderiaceae bacterium]